MKYTLTRVNIEDGKKESEMNMWRTSIGIAEEALSSERRASSDFCQERKQSRARRNDVGSEKGSSVRTRKQPDHEA